MSSIHQHQHDAQRRPDLVDDPQSLSIGVICCGTIHTERSIHQGIPDDRRSESFQIVLWRRRGGGIPARSDVVDHGQSSFAFFVHLADWSGRLIAQSDHVDDRFLCLWSLALWFLCGTSLVCVFSFASFTLSGGNHLKQDHKIRDPLFLP
jgi:hypothetical protein